MCIIYAEKEVDILYTRSYALSRIHSRKFTLSQCAYYIIIILSLCEMNREQYKRVYIFLYGGCDIFRAFHKWKKTIRYMVIRKIKVKSVKILNILGECSV